MTLSDLWQCIKRYWYIVVGLPVACGAVAVIMVIGSPGQVVVTSYSGSARIIANSGIGTVAGYAANEAAEWNAKDETIKVSTKADAATMTVAIAVTGENGEKCEEALEAIASATIEASRLAFIDTYSADTGYTGIPFSATVEDVRVTEATPEEESSDALKFIAIAIFAAFLIGICVVVLIYMARRPIVSERDIEEAIGLPMLAPSSQQQEGERLLANIRFAAKNNDLKSICIIPIGTGDSADTVCQKLDEAIQEEGLRTRLFTQAEAMSNADLDQGDGLAIICCNSLNEAMAPAYVAQRADATVMAVRKWKDSIPDLQQVVAELQLAEANLVGIAFVNS